MGEKEERRAQTLDLLTQNHINIREINKLNFTEMEQTSREDYHHQQRVVQQKKTLMDVCPLLGIGKRVEDMEQI